MAATLIRKQDAPRFEVAGAEVTGYASPSRGSGSLAAWRVALRPGASSPVHSLETDEVFIALRGQAEFHLDGQVLSVGAGDGLTVAAGTSFRIVVTSAEGFEAAACVPAGSRARIGDGEPFAPPWAV